MLVRQTSEVECGADAERRSCRDDGRIAGTYGRGQGGAVILPTCGEGAACLREGALNQGESSCDVYKRASEHCVFAMGERGQSSVLYTIVAMLSASHPGPSAHRGGPDAYIRRRRQAAERDIDVENKWRGSVDLRTANLKRDESFSLIRNGRG